MLEESRTIDTIAKSQDGVIELVIMDAGMTTDPEERFGHLVAKLKSYVYYVIEGDFKKEYPDKSIRDVRIRVMCRIPPTERMSRLVRLTNPDNESEGINIIYQHFPGADDAIEETRSDRAIPPTKPQSNRIVLYASYGLAIVTILAALPGVLRAGRNPTVALIVAIIFVIAGHALSHRKRA